MSTTPIESSNVGDSVGGGAGDGIDVPTIPVEDDAPPMLARRKLPRSFWWLATPLVLLALISLLAPWLPITPPSQQDLQNRFVPPFWMDGGTWSRPFGTDQLGRDIFSRIIYGGRLTFLIAFSAVLFGSLFGTLLGMLAGYQRGWTDAVISRLIEAQLALPVILLAMAVIVSAGRSLTVLVLVLAVIGWAQYARVVRAETLALRERPFILGLRAAGAPTWRVVLRHIFPNIGSTFLVLTTLEVGAMILAESALSFLGLGVVAPDVSWGAMLADGREFLRDAWWLVTIPGIFITLVVLLVNLLGDVLRTTYDVRKRNY
jgi:peptide/nickel transport system permease protein